MNTPNQFPPWIVEAVSGNRNQLTPDASKFFDQCMELFPHIDSHFLSIPATSDLGVLKSYDPAEVHDQYGVKSPNELILLNIFELFHFQAKYQLRELSLSLMHALEEGRFYVAAITSRAMLEVVCVNYYTFRRVDEQFKQCLQYLRTAAKTKSHVEKAKLLDKYARGSYEIFSKLFDANLATSIDWKAHLFDKYVLSTEAPEATKKVHVNTAIEDIEKQSGLRLSSAYHVLSEFVHPNAGSKMLIVNTRTAHDPLMDKLKIGDNKGNVEAALFCIDHLAESIFYTWTLALTLSDRGQKLITVLDDFVAASRRTALR